MNRIRAAAYCARAHQREPVGRWTVLDWKLDRRWAAHEDITESLRLTEYGRKKNSRTCSDSHERAVDWNQRRQKNLHGTVVPMA
jgi:hypothetical protein